MSEWRENIERARAMLGVIDADGVHFHWEEVSTDGMIAAHAALHALAAQIEELERRDRSRRHLAERAETAEQRVKELEAAEAALVEILRWMPATQVRLAELHPQHREAIKKSCAALAQSEDAG